MYFHWLCDWEFGNADATTWIYEFPSLFDVEDFIRGPGLSARVRRYLVSMKWIHGMQQQESVNTRGDFPIHNCDGAMGSIRGASQACWYLLLT